MEDTLGVTSRVALLMMSLLGPSAVRAEDMAGVFAEARSALERGRAGDAAAGARASELFQKLSESNPENPLYLAYWGSSWTLRGRNAWAPWNKMKLTEGGLDKIDRALAMLSPAHDQAMMRGVPVSVETRLVAASTFLALPSLFHRFEDGKAVVAAALVSPAFERSPAPVRAQLKNQASLVARKEKRDADEAESLRSVLALQADGPVAEQARVRLRELER
jgi:hypothetical protein